jgi:hypothetical protein
VEARQFYGRKILAQRIAFQRARWADYYTWYAAQIKQVSQIQSKSERRVARDKLEAEAAKRRSVRDQYQTESWRMAKRWKLARKDVKDTKQRADILSRITAPILRRTLAPTERFLRTAPASWQQAMKKGGAAPEGLSGIELRRFEMFKKHWRPGATPFGRQAGPGPAALPGFGGFALPSLPGTFRGEQLGGMVPTAPSPAAAGRARMFPETILSGGGGGGGAGLVEALKATAESAKRQADAMAQHPTVTNIYMDGEKVANVVTKHQESKDRDTDGTGSIMGQTGFAPALIGGEG